MDIDDEETQIIKEKFTISGIVSSPAFQRCRFLAVKLHRSFPRQHELPDIKPMLNVEWEEYFTKMKRTYGNGVWALKKPVMVFTNDQYLGDDRAFVNYLIKRYRFSLNLDLNEVGKCHLVDMLRDIMGKYRQIAYLTVALNNQVIGSLMFELYNDLVPLACENFLERCKDIKDGYTGTPIHRIMKNSWIQCGGWKLTNKRMPCENYVIPHDRRGVLCTTNVGRHKENNTQFFVTLAPTPWMDSKYVAFGQLLQGEEVLKVIENVPTYYESPKWPIDIVMSGEVTLDGIPDYFNSINRQENILPSAVLDNLHQMSDYDLVPTSSRFSMTKFKKGLYSLETDMRNYLAFANLPDYLIPRTVKSGSEGSSTTLDVCKFVPMDRHQLGLQASVTDFSKTQDILRDCRMPTISDTTI